MGPELLVRLCRPFDPRAIVRTDFRRLATALGVTIVCASALATEQAGTKDRFPEWLQQLDGHGLLVSVDDVGDVVGITAGQVVNDELLAKFASLPSLRVLHIEVTDRVTPDGLLHLGKMTSLTRLTLYNVNADGKGLGDEAIVSVMGLKGLVDLKVSECGTTDVGVRCLEGMPQLRRLNLQQEGRLTDKAIVSIGKLTELRHLDLSSYVATEAYGRMQFSAEALRRLTTLKQLESLYLVGQPVPPDAIVFKRLKSLSLGGDAIDDACAARVAECHDLTSLELFYTGVTDAGLKQIAELPRLSHLDLDSHVVTDDGIAHLKRLRGLQTLSLRASRLTEETLKHLTEVNALTRLELHGSGHPGNVRGERLPLSDMARLKALPNLHTLSLTNFDSSKGYRELGAISQLKVLKLSFSNINEGDVRALREALPDTKIYALGSSLLGFVGNSIPPNWAPTK